MNPVVCASNTPLLFIPNNYVYLVAKRVFIYLLEWVSYIFLLQIISGRRDRGWLPKLMLLIIIPYICHEYWHLDQLENLANIRQTVPFSEGYLVFRYLMVTLDLIASFRLIYWLHYQLHEKDWWVLWPVWSGTLVFNGIGFYCLRQLETDHLLYQWP